MVRTAIVLFTIVGIKGRSGDSCGEGVKLRESQGRYRYIVSLAGRSRIGVRTVGIECGCD